MKEEKKKFNYVPIIGLIIFTPICYMVQTKYLEIQKDIDDNLTIGVAKVFKFKTRKATQYAYYQYYYKNKLYEHSTSINTDKEQQFNNYYIVEFSSKNPEHSRILLDKQVTDKNKIQEAGF